MKLVQNSMCKNLADENETLNKEITNVKTEISRTTREIMDKTGMINRMEKEISSIESQRQEQENTYRKLLEEEAKKHDLQENVVSNLQKALDESRRAEALTRENCQAYVQQLQQSQNQLNVLSSELKTVRQAHEGLYQELEKMTQAYSQAQAKLEQNFQRQATLSMRSEGDSILINRNGTGGAHGTQNQYMSPLGTDRDGYMPTLNGEGLTPGGQAYEVDERSHKQHKVLMPSAKPCVNCNLM